MPVEYVLPVGLHFDEPTGPIDEGYEVVWRDDENPPHYLFYAQVSVLRLERIVREAMAFLPRECHAVLEVRRSDAEMDADPRGPSQDRWISPIVDRSEVLSVIERYGYALLHDGMVGFGAYDPGSALEVFVDDHKLLSLFAPALEPFESLFERFRIPCLREVGRAFDAPHDHYTLYGLPDELAPAGVEHLRKRRLDVEWFSKAIQTRLAMKRQANPVGE